MDTTAKTTTTTTASFTSKNTTRSSARATSNKSAAKKDLEGDGNSNNSNINAQQSRPKKSKPAAMSTEHNSELPDIFFKPLEEEITAEVKAAPKKSEPTVVNTKIVPNNKTIPVASLPKKMPKSRMSAREQMLSRYDSMNLAVPDELAAAKRPLKMTANLKTYTRTPMMSMKPKVASSSSSTTAAAAAAAKKPDDIVGQIMKSTTEMVSGKRKFDDSDGGGSSEKLVPATASTSKPREATKVARTDNYLPILASMAQDAQKMAVPIPAQKGLKTYSRKSATTTTTTTTSEKVADDRKTVASSHSGNIQRTAHRTTVVSANMPNSTIATKIAMPSRIVFYNNLMEAMEAVNEKNIVKWTKAEMIDKVKEMEANMAQASTTILAYRNKMASALLKIKSGRPLVETEKPMSKTEEKARAMMAVISRDQLQEIIGSFVVSADDKQLNGYRKQDPQGKVGHAKPTAGVEPKEVSEVKTFTCKRCHQVVSFPVAVKETMQCFYHKKRSGWCCRTDSRDTSQTFEPCQSAAYHSIDEAVFADTWRGYVSTTMLPNSKHLVVALDCEMVYTEFGNRLARVSVVDFEGKCIYERLVQPKAKVLDYLTEFSGLDEAAMERATVTLEDVQQDLRALISADTVVVGHSLESDLNQLKLFHDQVVDTALLYPHKRGPPLKRALKTLANEVLNRIIQTGDEEGGGHDSLEDAVSSLELFKAKLFDYLAKLKVDKVENVDKVEKVDKVAATPSG